MENLQWILPVGILTIFGGIVFLMIRAEYQLRERKLRFIQSLGFTPIEPQPELVQKINDLYKSMRFKLGSQEGDPYELQNVSTKKLPGAEMYLFDLIDTSGEDNSYIENQAAAIISSELDLPPFLIFPKTDHEGIVANTGNKILTWLVAQVGNPVAFLQFPEFEQRYLVSSPNPDAIRQFLDDYKIRRLTTTSLLTIHASGDIFTLSRIDEAAKPLSQEMLAERVNLARKIYAAFLA